MSKIVANCCDGNATYISLRNLKFWLVCLQGSDTNQSQLCRTNTMLKPFVSGIWKDVVISAKLMEETQSIEMSGLGYKLKLLFN